MGKGFKSLLKAPAEAWLYHKWKKIPFCIVSNDCFGGEVYRYARRPYNTPFVGLMIMAPCYIKLLSDLKGYLASPLQFLSESRYLEMNGFRQKHNNYPIGQLRDIEIHFLHYPSERVARDTWNRRCIRMDYSHLRIKCSLGKDYAKETDAAAFASLSFAHMLCMGPGEKMEYDKYWQIPRLQVNAAVAFRQSLACISLKGWLQGKAIKPLRGFSKYWYRAISFLLSI